MLRVVVCSFLWAGCVRVLVMSLQQPSVTPVLYRSLFLFSQHPCVASWLPNVLLRDVVTLASFCCTSCQQQSQYMEYVMSDSLVSLSFLAQHPCVASWLPNVLLRDVDTLASFCCTSLQQQSRYMEHVMSDSLSNCLLLATPLCCMMAS